MSGQRIASIIVLGLLALVVIAWFDGGEEPLHPIEQAVLLPEGVR